MRQPPTESPIHRRNTDVRTDASPPRHPLLGPPFTTSCQSGRIFSSAIRFSSLAVTSNRKPWKLKT